MNRGTKRPSRLAEWEDAARTDWGWIRRGAWAEGERVRMSLGERFFRLLPGVTALLLGMPIWIIPIHGAAPSLNQLYPAGAGVGSSNRVAVVGKFDPWPPKFWVEGDGVVFRGTTNTGWVQVEIAADAVPGARWVRVFNDEGASEPRLFVVGPTAEPADTEPNNGFAAPQFVSRGPVTINGRLDKNGDVDSFGISVGAGEWLEARLDAYTLMSPLDAVLRIVTTNGHPLAWNHDLTTLDPGVTWQATEARTVVVQVYGFKYPADSSIQLYGGEGAVYRLHLRTFTELPPSAVPESPDEDTVKVVPAIYRGVVIADSAENRHRFRAEKDRLYSVRVAAQALGAAWDARMRIVDSKGEELAQNDDGEGTSDPRLDWRAPADGGYAVLVGSRTRKGSLRHRYELTLAEAVPDFRATSAVGAWVLPAGATNEVKVAVVRLNGFTNELRIAFSQLPEGVSAEPAKAPAGNGEVTLQLVATPQAAPWSGPVGIQVVSPGEGGSHPVEHDLVSRGENNGVPQGYSRLLRESTDRFWLTVRPPPEPPKP